MTGQSSTLSRVSIIHELNRSDSRQSGLPRVMCEPKNGPDNKVLIRYLILPFHHIVDSANFQLALERIPSRGIQFVFLVLGHPDVAVD